jgi:GNAT superfamily N-acetyltransferase
MPTCDLPRIRRSQLKGLIATHRMEITITFGIPENQEERAANILYEAFEDKFQKIFGPKERTLSVFNHFCNERTLVALHKNTIVGVGGLIYGGKEYIDISFWQLLRHLKSGIFRFMFFGWVFVNRVEKNEIFIDVLAVTQEMRSKGIGSKIVNFVIDYACSQEYQQVRLFVIEPNERARAFYQKMGFEEKKIHTLLFPWNKTLGFNKAFEMVYRLTD